MESLPPLKLVSVMNDEDLANTFNWAFACPVVESIVTEGNEKIINIGTNLAPRYLWGEFYEALEKKGSVWISSEKREQDDYNEEGTFLYSETPKKGHWKVCYAKKPTNGLEWNSVTQQLEWTKKRTRSKKSRVRLPEPVLQKCTCQCICGGTSF